MPNNTLTFPADFISAINNIKKSPYAIIHTVYPEGSTCTCSDGTTTLTAEDTSGDYWFYVPNVGNWTVSCTDNERNSSENINISEYGQVKDIELKYLPIPGDVLNNYTWEDISMIAQAGVGDQYFDIGDCKALEVRSGALGSELNGLPSPLYIFILDFNHPINKTIPDNNIIFGGFKSALINGVDIALCGSNYSNSDSGGNNTVRYFNLNHHGSSGGVLNTNYGGWKGCDLRYDILGATSTQPKYYISNFSKKQIDNVGYDATEITMTRSVSGSLKSLLPNDFRNILRLWERYIDYKGNSSNEETNCSISTIDGGISLLTEFEVFGSRSYANQYEQNHQKQMTYYANGNNIKKYKHNDQTVGIYWWLSSPCYSSAVGFCNTSINGTASYNGSNYSYGLAPAFKV